MKYLWKQITKILEYWKGVGESPERKEWDTFKKPTSNVGEGVKRTENNASRLFGGETNLVLKEDELRMRVGWTWRTTRNLLTAQKNGIIEKSLIVHHKFLTLRIDSFYRVLEFGIRSTEFHFDDRCKRNSGVTNILGFRTTLYWIGDLRSVRN